MKIIKKAKIKPCKCQVCGCVMLPKLKDLVVSPYSLVKDVVVCKFCESHVHVNFEGVLDEDDKFKNQNQS